MSTGVHCPSVVIIEDDEAIRDSMRDLLELEGYSVAAYCNGKEAIDAIQHCSKPCLILLDLMMPVMNGWEFLKARRHLGDTIVASPVFIVSAQVDVEKVRETGAVGYMKKPIDIEVLLKIVQRHCGKPGNCVDDAEAAS